MKTKTNTMICLSFLLLTHGQGCDTHVAQPTTAPPNAECRVAEFVAVHTDGDPNMPVTTDDLCVVLEPGEVLSHVLSTLRPYGLERYTATFAERQVTYVWWVSAEAQDRALADFCGP